MTQIEASTLSQSTDPLSSIRECVKDDLRAIDSLIINQLFSDIPLIQQITRHIIAGGGKRLRPLLVVLCARAAGYDDPDQNEHLELATIIEFVHTATLLHDDVVDASKLRRGKETANARFGNQASVLVGDFLYSRSFQMLTRRSNVPIMQVLSDTTNAIAEGEVLQLMNCNDPDITKEAYYAVIHRKTAKLFESSAEIGGMLGHLTQSQIQSLAHYGRQLGMAFQIVDDLLDYTADSAEMGKNIGDDLAEGKATLPLIHAMANATPYQAQQIKAAIEHGGLENLNTILEAIEQTQARDYCIQKAEYFANQAATALTNIPVSQFRDALTNLAHFVVHRLY